MANRNAAIDHPLALELVPLLQIVHLVLTLLHTLRLLLAPLAHRRRHLLPVPPSQIPSIQLRKLIRIRIEKARDRRVAPLLPVLPVLSTGISSTAGGLRFLVIPVIVSAIAELIAILPLLAPHIDSNPIRLSTAIIKRIRTKTSVIVIFAIVLFLLLLVSLLLLTTVDSLRARGDGGGYNRLSLLLRRRVDLSRRSGGEAVRRVGLVEVMGARVWVRLVGVVVSVIVIVVEEREVVTGGGHFRRGAVS